MQFLRIGIGKIQIAARLCRFASKELERSGNRRSQICASGFSIKTPSHLGDCYGQL